MEIETKVDLPLDNVLDGARNNEIEECVVIGHLPGTTRLYIASCTANVGLIVTMLERAKLEMLALLDGK